MKTRVPSARCRAMLARVSAYLDDELASTKCRAIERHCATCEACAGVVAGLRRTVGLCRHAGDRPLPSAVRRKARAQIEALLEPPTGGRTSRRASRS